MGIDENVPLRHASAKEPRAIEGQNQDLLEIRTYWKSLTPELCMKYIDHLRKVMPAVVKEEGGPSGYSTSVFITDYIFAVL